MKVYLHSPSHNLSHCFRRIKDGISNHVQFVKEEHADIAIILAIEPSAVKRFKIPSVLWQLTYITGGTQEEWETAWNKVDFVTSYLKLPLNYLRMPLGYDSNTFYLENTDKVYDAITTGYVDGKEGEYISKVINVFDTSVHVGGKIKANKKYIHKEKISDEEMRRLYNMSKYTFSLREYEGFELPIIEGAACGSIPIYLDLECYDIWFNDIGIGIGPEEVSNIRNLSHELYAFKRKKALENIHKYTWDNVFKEYKFFEKIKQL